MDLIGYSKSYMDNRMDKADAFSILLLRVNKLDQGQSINKFFFATVLNDETCNFSPVICHCGLSQNATGKVAYGCCY